MLCHVMTFNVRCEVKSDGINYFPNREDKLIDAIFKEDPDLIGFQEAGDRIRERLRVRLRDRYTVIGCGRQKDYRGESCCIAYKQDTFDLLSFSTFFLSSEPNAPGSRYEGSDQSIYPRLCVSAQLSAKGAPPFWFFNTHLDHEGKTARLLSMNQIVQEISRCEGRFVLTGDINALPDTPEAALPLRMKGRAVVDATVHVGGTFHAFGQCEPVKIDYIYTDGQPLEAYALPDPHEGGVYLSDHYPVCAKIEL